MAANFAVAEIGPGNSREATHLCISWAQEFEAKYPDYKWGEDELDYIETIDAFFAEKYAAWKEFASDTRRNDEASTSLVAKRDNLLPHDPDEMNDKRAGWAQDAIQSFSDATGADMGEEALSDLLADIGHYCDRNGISLESAICWAASLYREETDGTGKQGYSGAPELLDALRGLKQFGGPGGTDAEEFARKAIAKAEGKR